MAAINPYLPKLIAFVEEIVQYTRTMNNDRKSHFICEHVNDPEFPYYQQALEINDLIKGTPFERLWDPFYTAVRSIEHDQALRSFNLITVELAKISKLALHIIQRKQRPAQRASAPESSGTTLKYIDFVKGYGRSPKIRKAIIELLNERHGFHLTEDDPLPEDDLDIWFVRPTVTDEDVKMNDGSN